jgi:hypothetical protein
MIRARGADEADREDVLGMTLASVAAGLGLAVAYYTIFLWFQRVVGRMSRAVQGAFMVSGMVLRLGVAAAVLVPLALYTRLNFLAVAVAFVCLYTILSGYGMYRAVARAKRSEGAAGPGPEGGVVGG